MIGLLAAIPMLLLTPAQAAAVAGIVTPGARLEPRLIDAGPYAGRYALPARVLDEPSLSPRRAALAKRQVVEVDPATAWPDQ